MALLVHGKASHGLSSSSRAVVSIIGLPVGNGWNENGGRDGWNENDGRESDEFDLDLAKTLVPPPPVDLHRRKLVSCAIATLVSFGPFG